VGAKGQLIFFQPHYDEPALYNVEYHSSKESTRNTNNLIGRPTLKQSIDGFYSEVQCWSTVVIPPEVQTTENPNEQNRHSEFKPSRNPLPFFRWHVFSDSEAINDTLRKNRAVWKYQMGQFESWTYECEFNRHSQGGAFFVANTMISVNDTVHQVSGT